MHIGDLFFLSGNNDSWLSLRGHVPLRAAIFIKDEAKVWLWHSNGTTPILLFVTFVYDRERFIEELILGFHSRIKLPRIISDHFPKGMSKIEWMNDFGRFLQYLFLLCEARQNTKGISHFFSRHYVECSLDDISGKFHKIKVHSDTFILLANFTRGAPISIFFPNFLFLSCGKGSQDDWVDSIDLSGENSLYFGGSY